MTRERQGWVHVPLVHRRHHLLDSVARGDQILADTVQVARMEGLRTNSVHPNKRAWAN